MPRRKIHPPMLIDHRALQQFSQFHQRLQSRRRTCRTRSHDHRILRRHQHLRDLVDRALISRRRSAEPHTSGRADSRRQESGSPAVRHPPPAPRASSEASSPVDKPVQSTSPKCCSDAGLSSHFVKSRIIAAASCTLCSHSTDPRRSAAFEMFPRIRTFGT